MADDAGSGTRREKDTLGAMEVPADALYGAQTARAIDNFPVSGWRMPGPFLAALAQIKAAYAHAAGEVGLLVPEVAAAIVAAADEVAGGGYRDHFPVDVFQTGSGTSTNMNMNEVVARLADRRLKTGDATARAVHPNDHVNLGQSSNDTIPAALRVAVLREWRAQVRPAAEALADELKRLAENSAGVVTLGRTHLMDAVPTTYGRTFDAWSRRVRLAVERAETVSVDLTTLPLGGTAVGTGIGSDPRVAARAVEILAQRMDLDLKAAANPAVGIAAQEAPTAFADALAGIARVLFAVANDLRLRGSGPFGGIGELKLAAVQPGSSIMPGKVNPVIPEAVAQVAIEVEGLAAACRGSAALHQLDLSHANPLLAWNLDTMCMLLARACRILVEKCLRGLEIDRDRARALAEVSPALATALARRLGYEKAAEVAKAAETAGETVMATALRLEVLPQAELKALLDLDRLAQP